MPELLKNIYNTHFFEQLTSILAECIPDFDKQTFLDRIYTSNWHQLELKQRMRHISLAILELLPPDFTQAQPVILSVSRKARQQPSVNAFPYIFLPDLIEIKGQHHLELSMKALEEITSFISAEFAVRPFLVRYKEEMLAQLLSWSKHPNEHVRRLSSEGGRSRLPWAMAVAYLKKEPECILPILENLKSDPSEYVRRSVANNLNDISKDHPQLVIQTAARWIGQYPQTDALLKHACRTLLKQGNPEVLKLFGFGTRNSVSDSRLQLDKSEYRLGETVEFTFSCQAAATLHARLQYIIDFARKSGKSSRKVFYLDEATLETEQPYTIHKKFKLQHYTTRQLYAGEHQISIMLNGDEKATARFYLTTE
ncbi:DNA alkylation repair protein [Rhodocytophaga rosea]|uniref:DNA alkylation repair protein n=1 Tax=Rhodocytophaga rosea TaxID=2704465 RepID=A0A6C0GGJ4_9BACT|nr:DNA alkylation repair protein [Rhodocytophaga rosea]QHT66903.1 DNA alkylation repair protein [Rhodocytophaga rosea]